MLYFAKKSIEKFNKYIDVIINIIIGCCSIAGIILGAYLFGFDVEYFYKVKVIFLFRIFLYVFCLIFPIRFIFHRIGKEKQGMGNMRWTIIFILAFVFLMDIGFLKNMGILYASQQVQNIILTAAILIISIVEISQGAVRIMTRMVNPMAIFVWSFFFIIIVGAILLSFPNSTYQEGNLSVVDALFVSTSATCVTGLCPVNFTTTFTLYGQIVVLCLIQIGGLGVVTLTSFFALSLMGALPFNSSLMIKDLISENSSNNISSLVIRIIGTTLTIEAIGAVFIYMTTRDYLLGTHIELIYFSIFHSISAFCNAGFSINDGGLCTPNLIVNNSFYYIISFLIILGGIGFPVYQNLFKVIGIRLRNLLKRISRKRVKRYVHQWDLNSIIVLRMTSFLLIAGTAYFLIFEWNGLLSGLSIDNKISQAFFNSVLPRTAGFTSQDITSLTPLTFIVIILLMWIGGAPQSTAGGIKVTTFTILLRNAICQIRGLGRVEINKNEVSNISVQRALAMVVLNVSVIFCAYIALLFTDPHIEANRLLFEVFSAIGTVGSSMNVTPELSNTGKSIITAVMFIGRIGIITILASFIKQRKNLNYRYPSGYILIN